MSLLSPEEISQQLEQLPGWEHREAAIVRVFSFKGFVEAVGFVDRIVAPAEEANHHPDIDIRWNKVRLLLTTHDQGGLTAKDFQLARVLDKESRTAS